MRLTYVRRNVRRTRLRAIPLAMSMKNCQHAPQYKYGAPLGSSAINVCKKNRDRPTPGKAQKRFQYPGSYVPPTPSNGSVNSMRGHSPPPGAFDGHLSFCRSSGGAFFSKKNVILSATGKRKYVFKKNAITPTPS